MPIKIDPKAATPPTDAEILHALSGYLDGFASNAAYARGDAVDITDADLVARGQLLRPLGVVCSFNPVTSEMNVVAAHRTGKEIVIRVAMGQVAKRPAETKSPDAPDQA